MATGFGVAKLSAYIHHATMTTKSISCTSRRYFKSACSLSNHGTNWPPLAAPSVCVPFKALHQGYILSKSFTDQAKTINPKDETKILDTKSNTTELEGEREENIVKHNNVIPKSSSSPESKTCSSSVSSCPILCPMCHGHIGYRCDDKSLTELMSLQSRSIKIEPKFQVRYTETRVEEINPESNKKNVEYNTVIPKLRPRSPLPVRPSCSNTNSPRLIVCPMCHKNIMHGSRNTEKRSYRVVPLITSQVRVFDFVTEVKDSGIKAAFDAVRAAYNKVIPKCPKSGSPGPPPCPPCPCCPTCPPCCPSCPPCCPSCPPCDPCEPCPCCPPCQPFCPRCPPCPSCPSGSSDSKGPTGAASNDRSSTNVMPICTVPAQKTDIVLEEDNIDSKLETDENNQARSKFPEKIDPADVVLRDRVQRVRNKHTLLNLRQRSRVCNYNIHSLSKNRRREALSRNKQDP